jgi:hypothetical protein
LIIHIYRNKFLSKPHENRFKSRFLHSFLIETWRAIVADLGLLSIFCDHRASEYTFAKGGFNMFVDANGVQPVLVEIKAD